jgi:hypothetical protein
VHEAEAKARDNQEENKYTKLFEGLYVQPEFVEAAKILGNKGNLEAELIAQRSMVRRSMLSSSDSLADIPSSSCCVASDDTTPTEPEEIKIKVLKETGEEAV